MKLSLNSLRGKISLFIALTFLIVVSFSIYLFIETLKARRESEEIHSLRFPMSQAITSLISNLNHQFEVYHKNVLDHDTTGVEEAELNWWNDVTPGVNFLINQKKIFSSDHQGRIEELLVLFKSYREAQQNINDWISENYFGSQTDSAFLVALPSLHQSELLPLDDQLADLQDQISNTLSTLQKDNENLIKADLVMIREQASNSSWMSVIFAISIVVILIVGGYKIITSLRESLEGPENTLKKLVEGDTSEQAQTNVEEMNGITDSTNKLSANLQRASNFAQSIGEGNFDFDFQPVSEKDVLGNSLVQMRNKLKSITEADRKRNWVTEGLAKFADIMRRNDDYHELSNVIIADLVKYTKANQGGLFILNRDNESDIHLQLTACYAFERRKHLIKRVEVGEGLLGQCYLEGQRIYMEEVPGSYLTITSGLGTAEPNSLLIVPLKVNDVIEGVIELASFKKFEPHVIEFVERVGEIIASTVSNARVNNRTRKLLEESQLQSEQMRAQEEEMRQNMEEMQATQEQMQRQADEMRKMQKTLEVERSMLHVLMEYLPDRITYKDKESRILRVNRAKAVKFNLEPEEFVGKTDYDFFNKEHAEKAMRDEKQLIESGKATIDVEERFVFNQTGDVGWSSVSRIPFRNDSGEIIGVIIIAKDTTRVKIAESSLQDREKIIARLLDNMPVFRYTIGRDGNLNNLWKSRALPDFDLSAYESTSVKETMPEVYDLISANGLEDSNFVCKQVIDINGEKEIFKHFFFKDSAHEGVYLGFAVKQ